MVALCIVVLSSFLFSEKGHRQRIAKERPTASELRRMFTYINYMDKSYVQNKEIEMLRRAWIHNKQDIRDWYDKMLKGLLFAETNKRRKLAKKQLR